MATPLKKLAKDKAALKWLAKHEDEFPFTGLLPQRQSFPRVYLADQKYHADLIAAAMPFKNPTNQRVAELYLQMPARHIAKELGLSRRRVYAVIFRIKNIAKKQWAEKRARLLEGRDEQLTPPGLETHPEHIALRTLRFTHGDAVRHAYLLERGDVWVDEAGRAFPADVQEILHNHHEDLDPDSDELAWEE